MSRRIRQLIAEFFGTFTLVFAGTGAIVINDISHGAITHVGIALTFGLVVLAMIYSLGDVSGCHLNPAVSIAFWIARRFEASQLTGYIAVQCIGALLASLVLKGLFPTHPTLGATLPAGSPFQSLILEYILTLILLFVILSVSSGSQEKGAMAGVAIGSVIALEAMFAGPICGASMNPARSLGPAVVAGCTGELWVYLIGPVMGAGTGVLMYYAIHDPKTEMATQKLN